MRDRVIYSQRELFIDYVIDAIVTSLDKDNLLVTPNGNVNFASLMNKRVRYIDNGDRLWRGKIVAVEEPYATVKFEQFPSGLGQGQIVQILEDNEREDAE